MPNDMASLWSVSQPRALEECYGFSCDCRLCHACSSSLLEALACPACNHGAASPTDNGACCSGCGAAVAEKWLRASGDKVDMLHHKARPRHHPPTHPPCTSLRIYDGYDLQPLNNPRTGKTRFCG